MRRNNQVIIILLTPIWICLAQVQMNNAAGADKEQPVEQNLDKAAANEQIVEFNVIDRTTKKPLQDVNLEIKINIEQREKKTFQEKTYAYGQCAIQLPDFPIKSFRVYPKKDGFVPLFIFWSSDPTPLEIPPKISIAMEPGTLIGGVIKNEQGEPISDVKVSVYYRKPDPDAAENADITIYERDIQTDRRGRWQFNGMPAEIDESRLRIFLAHPDYQSDNLMRGMIPMPITTQPSIESLRASDAVMVMKEGFSITGTVSDKDGNPIAGAKIYNREMY